jgi:AraC-like DNA-binding protein
MTALLQLNLALAATATAYQAWRADESFDRYLQRLRSCLDQAGSRFCWVCWAGPWPTPQVRHRSSRRSILPVAGAMRLFEDHLDHPWTLGELAQRLHMVPGSLVRLFTASVGQPPIAYLSQRRAEVAATLLLRDDRPIAHVGEVVGWPDPNYYARRFKAHLGMSASTYRKRFAATAPQVARSASRGESAARKV